MTAQDRAYVEEIKRMIERGNVEALKDWNTITIHGSKPTVAVPRKPTLADAQVIRTKTPAIVSELRKLENTESGKPKMLTPQSRAALAAARVAKGLTQKQLDQQGCFPLNSTNQWEVGRICPTSQQIQVLHRILQVKLERA